MRRWTLLLSRKKNLSIGTIVVLDGAVLAVASTL